ELVVTAHIESVGTEPGPGTLEERALNLDERVPGDFRHLGDRNVECLPLVAGAVASGEDDRILRDIARANLDSQRNPLEFPLVELPAGSLVVARVGLDS